MNAGPKMIALDAGADWAEKFLVAIFARICENPRHRMR